MPNAGATERSGSPYAFHYSLTMRTVPLAYYKEVLDKISHADRSTFRKELRKAFRQLLPEQREELKRWFRTACLCRPGFEERRS